MSLADRLSSYIASRAPGAIVSRFNFLISGFESEIYTFQLRQLNASPKNCILRLFSGEGSTEKLTREAKALALLPKSGYPVPTLFWQETDPEILGKPFEILDRLEGQALWPVLAAAEPRQQSRLLSRFGSLLAQLHQVDWRSLTIHPGVYEKNPTLLLEEIISPYRSLYTKYSLQGFLRLVDWLDVHKHELEVQPALVHQDFHANNVLLSSDDRLFVIDWTQFAVSDRRIDAAWTLLIMGEFGNPDWGRQILNVYESSQGRTEHLDYFNVFVYMKLLASTVIAFTFSPEELGMRPATAELTKEQLSIYRQLAQRIRNITGMTVPELEDMLERI